MTDIPIHSDAYRAYRETLRPRAGETGFQVVVDQTDLFVVAPRPLAREIADIVRAARRDVAGYLLADPAFGHSLTPVAVPDTAPAIVREMAEAASRFGVGPMAAVAGAVSQAVSDALAGEVPDLLVENGGDIVLRSRTERTVALLAQPAAGACLGLRFPPSALPAAVCASSATVGHSLSLGRADMVTVVADRGPVADAAATALANRLLAPDDLEAVLARATRLRSRGVRGVFAQFGELVGLVGDIDLVALD